MLLEFGITTVLDSWHLTEKQNVGYCRIYYVYECDAVYEDAYGCRQLDAGKLYILPSNLPYETRRKFEGDFSCLYLHVLILPLATFRLIERSVTEDSLERHLLGAIRKAIEHNDRALVEKLSEALVLTLQEQEGCLRVQETLVQVLEYIRVHLSDPLTVEMLAALVHFNPNYLIRLFKKEIGTTPYQYICEQRMHAALSLIRQGRSITEVAGMVGFQDRSSFARAFHEYWGVTPTRHHNIPNVP